jgi:hypothetical protein
MAMSTKPVLSKKAKVVALTDLVGVPEGTKGKVVLVNGISWIRYWVRFDNGITMGSINRSALATPEEWDHHVNGTTPGATAAVAGGGAAEAGADDGAAGGKMTANGTLVPAKLLERTQAARARLAA